jgi:hypothetical protein
MLRRMPTTAELLATWREATRVAELARELVEVAETASATAEDDADAAEEVGSLAEAAAQAAEAAAAKARATADRMQRAAATARGKGRQDAAATLAEASDDETSARESYQEAEREARARHHASKP